MTEGVAQEAAEPRRLVAIHQPNFFPWLGYFAKAMHADRFIILDHVQFSRGARINRVKLLIAGEAKWATASVRKVSGTPPINETWFDSSVPWKRKLLASIDAAYRKAPFYDEAMPVLRPLVEQDEENVARFNAAALLCLAELLGIARGKFLLSSEMATEQASTRLLIDLVRAAGGNVYLSGDGVGGYQEDELFAEAGIELAFQNFVPEPYPQQVKGDFVPGLSIIDALMNIGLAETRRMLERAGATVGPRA